MTFEEATKVMNEGNMKEAYQAFRKLTLDEKSPEMAGRALEQAVLCLQRLNRGSEIDALRDQALQQRSDQWPFLAQAANTYLSGYSYGYMIAGDFFRGHHRGGGKFVDASQRDRVRALRLLTKAIELAADETSADTKSKVARLHLQLAQALSHSRYGHAAWQLQFLTNLEELPDYGEQSAHHNITGAPVDEDGNPIFHQLPESWQNARTDGQRWRWALHQATQIDPALEESVKSTLAGFFGQQFGVSTLKQYGWFPGPVDDEDDARDKTYALDSLDDGETIARLANGVKRFQLPAEFNHVAIYRDLADKYDSVAAIYQLGTIYLNRRQFPKALAEFKRGQTIAPKTYGWDQQIRQIEDNWGRFEGNLTQPAGQGATIDFRFRNGNEVQFTAHQIDMNKLLSDMKTALKDGPRKANWRFNDINNLGYEILNEDNKKYIGNRVANWKLSLSPRDNHFDRRITVTTPLQQAGTYLLTAKMKNGNTSKIVVWLADMAIVARPMHGRKMYVVTDAKTGQPVPKANIEFLGFRRDYRKQRNQNRLFIQTKNFAEFTDENGIAYLDTKPEERGQYSWVAIARQGPERLAFLGFSNVWNATYQEQSYATQRAFVVTDRPVYRPQDPVEFKIWVRRSNYGQGQEKSAYAGEEFTVLVRNPKGEEIYKQKITADQYGGLEGELQLASDATLGVYSVALDGWGQHQMQTQADPYGRGPQVGGSFRVEEYKKPEFEVTINAPDAPIALGDKFQAQVEAKYYFGSPVTDATVSYKVMRTTHDGNWYPTRPWDWLYGPGYWWFGRDYDWYPGFSRWGCRCPSPWWFWRSPSQPEIVASGEAQLKQDGTFDLEIDTSVAKAIHPDHDHNYQIQVEVVDPSRRTIVANGSVLVARQPFRVFSWINRGFLRTGDSFQANFAARTLDGKPVAGKGKLRLLQVTYNDDEPQELEVAAWDLATDEQGTAQQRIAASEPGQYRLSYAVTDAQNRTIEGGYLFTVIGEGFDGRDFVYDDLELIPEKQEYRPGETVKLQINTNRRGGYVLLFLRPSNGVYQPPQIIRMAGKSQVVEIPVTRSDMPNFFVEATTVAAGKLHTATREIFLPPEKRVLNVDVQPSEEEYLPGEKAKVKVRLTDHEGRPYTGSTIVAIYDKSVEYISGGSNVPDIRSFFWKWRRNHQPQSENNLQRYASNLPVGDSMNDLGVFGHLVLDDISRNTRANGWNQLGARRQRFRSKMRSSTMEAVASPAAAAGQIDMDDMAYNESAVEELAAGELTEPAVRQSFADTALWVGSLMTNKDGFGEVELDMPENLTAWKIRVWGMGHGTRVGEGSAEVVTRKNLIVRLQAPRFFIEKDEVVLSANVHNYLDRAKQVDVRLELEGDTLSAMAGDMTQTVMIEPDGAQRVDWRVKVAREGQATIRMLALTDEESDAMQMDFPVYVHGMLKMDSYTGVVKAQEKQGRFTISVPQQRRPEQTRLEIRYSPTLAAAMLDALPYLIDYPYGCTEQTLNRFLPAVITRNVIRRTGVDLEQIRDKRTNLNAQEIGENDRRAAQWKRFDSDPVFDSEKLEAIVKEGVNRLTEMQLSDGGWGWFSGLREFSSAHTTAVVVHGLQIAEQNGVAIVPDTLQRGIAWLNAYQQRELAKLDNYQDGKPVNKKQPYKSKANNLDALVFMVLTDADQQDPKMRDYLYRDRTSLSVYSLATYGLALHKLQETDKRDMVMRNISQFLVEDDENQTAYLNLPGGYWWFWYGSEIEAHAYYLKLLAATQPDSDVAPRLVKYLLNNRRHATYWNSTRDTALVVEAFADYLTATGEDQPDMQVEIWIDGTKKKSVEINADNLFTFDNAFVIEGQELSGGKHTIELRKQGRGPLYFNGYLTNFTLEDYISQAGLELKVSRQYYRLLQVDKSIKAAGSRGQVVDQRIEKYRREPLSDLSELTSGDLVEIELEIDSKNDYEYILFEDMKPAGFEPVDVRSGYTNNEMRAYVEFRDNRVAMFVTRLARGKHSLSYRMRAETPGKFSALPTKAMAMYAPELKGNSDEIKLIVVDKE